MPRWVPPRPPLKSSAAGCWGRGPGVCSTLRRVPWALTHQPGSGLADRAAAGMSGPAPGAPHLPQLPSCLAAGMDQVEVPGAEHLSAPSPRGRLCLSPRLPPVCQCGGALWVTVESRCLAGNPESSAVRGAAAGLCGTAGG